jgi:hypothetical protein
MIGRPLFSRTLISESEVTFYKFFQDHPTDVYSVRAISNKTRISYPTAYKYVRLYHAAKMITCNAITFPALYRWSGAQSKEAKAHLARLKEAETGYARLRAQKS